MANANGASIGADQNGLTALLNSMASFDNTLHVGVINNIRLSTGLMREKTQAIGAMIRGFLANNGVQLNITCLGRDELRAAQCEPERYRNLIVRIGGFSARFIELNAIVQNEIILRTTYD
jgi:pyruvate-formate lyase